MKTDAEWGAAEKKKKSYRTSVSSCDVRNADRRIKSKGIKECQLLGGKGEEEKKDLAPKREVVQRA